MPHNQMHGSVHKPHHLQHAVTSKQSLLVQSYSMLQKKRSNSPASVGLTSSA